MLRTHLDNLGFVQLNFEYFQEKRFHNLSGQHVPTCDSCHGEVSLPKQNFPCCNLHGAVCFAEESGSTFSLPSH